MPLYSQTSNAGSQLINPQPTSKIDIIEKVRTELSKQFSLCANYKIYHLNKECSWLGFKTLVVSAMHQWGIWNRWWNIKSSGSSN